MKSKLSIETIERWLKDDDWHIRQAAMNACEGKDVPIDIIERWLKDDDRRIRQAAMELCKERGIPVPTTRSIEPPELVYKKCVGDVIVATTIPKDADVRGNIHGKCRTNKAKIVDIIGSIGGEKAGVSFYDPTTTYFVGDDVFIEDFDMSEKECSTGFHFFCTKEEAERYN